MTFCFSSKSPLHTHLPSGLPLHPFKAFATVSHSWRAGLTVSILEVNMPTLREECDLPNVTCVQRGERGPVDPTALESSDSDPTLRLDLPEQCHRQLHPKAKPFSPLFKTNPSSGLLAHPCNTSIQEAEAGGPLLVRDRPVVYNEFWASLGYPTRLPKDQTRGWVRM